MFHALALKRQVAHREHFIEQQNIRLQMRRHRKRQADIHAAAVTLHRRIDELPNLRKIHDIVKLRGDFLPPHADDRPVQENVFPPS